MPVSGQTPAQFAEAGIAQLLALVGEDPTREGLVDTPARVVRGLREMCDGYTADVKGILATTFDVSYSQLVIVTGIDFTSVCEHHLLPFVGTCDVGYIPRRRVVGLSKIPRLVDAYAHRLQVQERLTNEIAEAMQRELDPEGVAVVMRASHSCMACRGVRKTADMVTSAMLGALFTNAAARAEFLALAAHGT